MGLIYYNRAIETIRNIGIHHDLWHTQQKYKRNENKINFVFVAILKLMSQTRRTQMGEGKPGLLRQVV